MDNQMLDADDKAERETKRKARMREVAAEMLRKQVMAYRDRRTADSPLLNGVRAPEHLSAAQGAVYLAKRGV
jgi:hypothetical protein